MKLKRLFDYDDYKGTKNYLKTQSRYEIARTVLYFAISLSLFAAGIISTGDKMNLLTIVAVLGCLPACKSVVTMIMFLRYKGCTQGDMDILQNIEHKMTQLWDMVFTTYNKNFVFSHVTICGNTVVLYSADGKIDEQAAIKHLQNSLVLDGMKNISFKIYTNIEKYMQRVEQLTELQVDEEVSFAVKRTLLSIAL